MALYLDKNGQLVESELGLDELGEGYTEPTTQDLQRHNSQVDYDAQGLAGQAAETIGTGVKSMVRGAESGLRQLDPSIPATDDPAAPGTLYSQEDKFASERHPIATGVGQAALASPLGFGAGALGTGILGGAGAAIGAESAAGGYLQEAENAWLQDRDFSQEAALTNVGAGLLVGGGVMGIGALGGALTGGARRLGRNLLTEAEHGASARAARDLLDEAPLEKAGKATNLTADEIARRGPDDAGVSYLRDNADTLTDDLATKQAKAAQDLLDTYGEMAPLKQTREQVDELIPDAQIDQARWVAQAQRDTLAELDGIPGEAAAAARQRLTELGDSSDPARWFTEASETSDELLRARAKAARSGAESDVAERLGRAKSVLDDGLKDEGLWGGAAKFEGQRAAGYAKRYGEHIDEFEDAFFANGRTDPARFRAMLAGEADPAAVKAFESTLDSARATADVAEQFGRKAEAGRIRGAIDQLERTLRQGNAVRAAKATVSRGTKSPLRQGLEWLSREGARTVTEEAVETGFKGIGAVAGGMVGGPPGMVAGWLGGRYLSKRLSDPIAEGIAGAAGRAAGGTVGQGLDNLTAGAKGALGRVRARAGQEGAMYVSPSYPQGSSPVDLSGKSLRELGALDQPESFRQGTFKGLRADKDFASSGRASKAFDSRGHEEGIRVEVGDDGQPFLRDGRHRLTVAREQGRETVWGSVYSPDDPFEPVYRGEIPIGSGGGASGSMALSKGSNFTLGDVAKSPAGAVTGLGLGAVGAREAYLAQRDETREGAFGAVMGLAQSAKASLTRSVHKLLSRPTAGDSGLVVPPAPPKVTAANFDATRDHIDRMSRDPEYFAGVMAASFGSMPEAAPEVFSALSAEAAKTVQYLAAVAPGGASGGPFGQRFPVSSDELWEFNERMRALTDPDFVADELSRGSLSSTAIEAYELMRPKQYAHLQRTVFERLGELNTAGVPVTVATREQLDVLLNIDGGGDPALTWKVAERAYAAQARKAASASARDPGGGGKVSNAMTSGALATLQNGASAIAQTG